MWMISGLMVLMMSGLVADAEPAVFRLHRVESITDPDDPEHYALADAHPFGIWIPPLYDADLIEQWFGPPDQVADDLKGWAFAFDEAPDFGLILIPQRDGSALAKNWDFGVAVMGRIVQTRWRRPLGRAWLRALAVAQRAARPDEGT